MAIIQDPFKGLIDGVLQGHAIAQQLHQQSLQEEAYERRKQQDAREAQLQDLDTQMRFTQYGRPVQPGSNVVEQSASGTLPGVVPGLPGQTYGTNYVRPVDKGRLLKAKLSDGREIQTEAYTPEEFQKRATDTAMAGKVSEFSLQQQMADATRQHQLRTEGRPAPASLVARGLAKPGELMLPKDILATLAQVQTLEKPQYEKVSADESLVGIPRSTPFSLNAPDEGQETAQYDDLGAGTPWTPPEPREAQGPTQDGNPLLLAALPGQQARAEFVDRVRSAGQPPAPTAPTLTAAFTGKAKETNMTEDQMRWIAVHDPDPEKRAAAKTAIAGIVRDKIASRPVTNNIIPGVPSGPLTGNAALVHGEDYLKTLPPSFAARLKNIATGDELAPTGRAALTGPGGQMMSALYQYDPEFTPLLAQQRKQRLSEFNSSQSNRAGGQLLALNTMIHHADLYLDAVAELKNGTFKPGNAIYNTVANMFGAAPPTTARLLAQFFASETGKVATGGVPAEGEIKGILEKMSTDGSPEAMERAGKTLIAIAAGRMEPLKQFRDEAKLEKFVTILHPDSQAILQKRGFDPETMKPVIVGKGPGQGAGSHIIHVNGKDYQYNGTGATDDMKNYTEVKK